MLGGDAAARLAVFLVFFEVVCLLFPLSKASFIFASVCRY